MLLTRQITVHSVVKNEPFIWYSIMSVYHWVDRILLYDTGSNDAHTLEDIEELLRYDREHENKITFKQVPIDVDETCWNFDNLYQMMEASKSLMNTVGSVRKQQILDTETEFFLILDGDEVYHHEAVVMISEDIIQEWNDKYIAGYIPLRWMASTDSTHHVRNGEYTCRIFKTADTWVDDVSPGEMHIEKSTRKPLSPRHPKITRFPNLPAFAHFELMLKPWRRKAEGVRVFQGELPGVMQENPYYVERFLREGGPKYPQVVKDTPRSAPKTENNYITLYRGDSTRNFIPHFVQAASRCRSVLEIGCGEANFLNKVRSPIKIGIDAFRPVMQSRNHKNILFLEYDLTKGLSSLVLPNSVECVAGIDVVEHFEKEQGLQLIRDCEQVATRCVLFFIPVGNHPQTKDDRGHGNDYYQTHRSTWYPEDLADMGYDVCFIPDYGRNPDKDPGVMFCFKALQEGFPSINWKEGLK